VAGLDFLPAVFYVINMPWKSGFKQVKSQRD
jgi:hypothetical protein